MQEGGQALHDEQDADGQDSPECPQCKDDDPTNDGCCYGNLETVHGQHHIPQHLRQLCQGRGEERERDTEMEEGEGVIVCTDRRGRGRVPRVAGRRPCWRWCPGSTLWYEWPGG